MNDGGARERMRKLAVEMIGQIMDKADMLTNVTGMKPVIFMSRRVARMIAASWPLEYRIIEPNGVERIMLEGYEVELCDVEDGVCVGYRI